MSQIILSNCKLWVAGYDMSGKLNSIALDDGRETLDCTTFGDTAKNRKKGLPLTTAALAGFFEAEETDEFFSNFTLINQPITIAPLPTEGGLAYSFLSQTVEYSFGGSVGELLKFSVKAESMGTKMIRGHILANRTGIIETDNGIAFNLGAVAEGQKLYGVLHVISTAETNDDKLDVIVESDSAETFDVSPETQLTFAQIAGDDERIYKFDLASGPIADTWFRVNWTITDEDDPSFQFIVWVGVK